jgi:hypothetical protein
MRTSASAANGTIHDNSSTLPISTFRSCRRFLSNANLLRRTLGVNVREHLSVYSVATLANLLLSVPQFQAVNKALDLGIRPAGMTGALVSQYGSTTGLLLESVTSILIFQGILAVLMLGVSASASSRGWKWRYSVTSILVASYLAYHLGGKFLSALGWIGVLETSGVNVSGVYGNLFWFGLSATICYMSSILVLRRSYGKLATMPPSRVI